MPPLPDTRSRVVQAAARLLWIQGLHGTGVQQILDESAAPKGSLYFHFPGGKEQLAAEAVREAGRSVTQAMQATLARHDNVTDALRLFVADFARRMRKSDWRQGCPITTVTLEAAATSELIRVSCEESYADWQRLIAGRLASSGWSHRRADNMATFVLAAVEGALVLTRAKQDLSPLRVVADEIAALIRARTPRTRQGARRRPN